MVLICFDEKYRVAEVLHDDRSFDRLVMGSRHTHTHIQYIYIYLGPECPSFLEAVIKIWHLTAYYRLNPVF